MARRRGSGVPGGAIALVVFGVVLLAGLWVTILGRIRLERAEAVEAEFGRNTNLALALDVQTQQLIQGIDQFLVLMRHQAEHTPPRVPLTELVAPAFAGTRNITLMGVFDARGDVLESVSEFAATSAADRPMFRFHRDNPSRDLLVSPPVLGRMSGRWVITFTRRVDRPDGSFGGMVLISLEPRYLTSLFEQTTLGPLDVMTQALESGITLALRRGPATSFGSDISGSQLLREVAARRIGRYVDDGEQDGHRRIVAYRELSNYPVIAAVATSEAAALAPVEQRARTYYTVGTLVSLAITLVCLVGAGLLVRQQRANRRLTEQASLLDEAQDAIMVSGLDDRLTYWNRSAERLYGWPAREVIGRTLADVLYPHDRAAVEAALGAATDTGTWVGELQPRARDGRRVITQSRWTLVRDRRGEPMSLLTIDTDVTDRRQLEQQFYRAQRLESIGTLAGGIAHDLNNVLQPIMLANEILYEQATDDDTRDLLAKVGDSARRGAEMVRQVLSFARGQDGRRVEVPVGPLIDDVVQIARDTLPKDITIAASVEDGLPPLVGDPTQFHQVLLNLCVNARDAMPGGGHLRLAASKVLLPSPGEPVLGDAAAGTFVVLEVEDTGIGIPPGDIDRIFDPFFTTKAPGKGTGLGLSTSLTIVRNHGGQIRVLSEPGRGTRFRVYLPASGAVPAAPLEAPARPTTAGEGRRVLFVDDEPAIRHVAKQALEGAGYRVLVATNGAEAVNIVTADPAAIDVVVTDMMMPVLGGEGLIRELRRRAPAVRIIAASGISSNEALARAAGLPPGCFLAKPFTAPALLQVLSDVLAR
ncbi:MAG: response regulator [Acidobacteria bacterium]|nr:response regulator [Acidobacteriota bacterium]